MVDETLIHTLKKIVTDEMILIWKRNYNSLADKASKANAYMNEAGVPIGDKDKQLLKYVIEITEPFFKYIELFQLLGIPIPENPFEGFPEAR